jgi:hypothetical protein
VSSTGLARATPDYDKITTWDLGSVLAALFSARVLGFLSEDDYHARVRRTLRTLEQLPLFDRAVFNKGYDARTGQMTGRGGVVSSAGSGWSATDLGRLLVWLSIVALSDTTHAAQATRVARRIDYDRVVSQGYLHGEERGSSGRMRRFQEGRIGYEQYAARGFALWGQVLPFALDLLKNAEKIRVDSVELLRDRRGLDRLTSEPFILLGLEVGWTRDESLLARNVLRMQEQRFRRTGIVTIVSEDAVNVRPQYFYYYCVLCNGKSFVIDIANPGSTLDSPRWVSTKAAFAWHALVPSPYTAWALRRVARSYSDRAISSGVFEKDGASTRTQDVNVAAVVLEAAAYRKIGRPLLFARSRSTPIRR